MCRVSLKEEWEERKERNEEGRKEGRDWKGSMLE